MIYAISGMNTNRPTILIGLSDGSISKLKKGDPIIIDALSGKTIYDIIGFTNDRWKLCIFWSTEYSFTIYPTNKILTLVLDDITIETMNKKDSRFLILNPNQLDFTIAITNGRDEFSMEEQLIKGHKNHHTKVRHTGYYPTQLPPCEN